MDRGRADGFQVISETIKERTVLQIKTALQKKAYEEAGIQVQNSGASNKIMQGEDQGTNTIYSLWEIHFCRPVGWQLGRGHPERPERQRERGGRGEP